MTRTVLPDCQQRWSIAMSSPLHSRHSNMTLAAVGSCSRAVVVDIVHLLRPISRLNRGRCLGHYKCDDLSGLEAQGVRVEGFRVYGKLLVLRWWQYRAVRKKCLHALSTITMSIGRVFNQRQGCSAVILTIRMQNIAEPRPS